MKPHDLPRDVSPPRVNDAADVSGHDAADGLLLASLLSTQRVPSVETAPRESIPGALIGELLALVDGGETALVIYPGQPGTAALRAGTVVDLHGAHIGAAVMLMFDDGDPLRPIVMGVVRGRASWPLVDPPGQFQVERDGERMFVAAREQLVLRCGKASITLTKAGKVLIDGTHVSSRSSGVNRIKGGSVQIN